MKTWIEIEFDITISNCKLYWDVTFPTLKIRNKNRLYEFSSESNRNP